MKKITILSFLFSFLCITAYTQTPPGSSKEDKKDAVREEVSPQGIQWAKDRTSRVSALLNLTPDQEKRVLEVNLRYADRMEKINGSSMDDNTVQKEHDQMFDRRLEEYKSILNADQQDKLKTYHKELKDDDGASRLTRAEKKEEIKDKAKEKDMNKEDLKDMKEEKKEEKKSE